MNITQTVACTYTIMPNGAIFTSDVTNTTSDDGTVNVFSDPHIQSYAPGSDLSQSSDATLQSIAALIWTDAIVAQNVALIWGGVWDRRLNDLLDHIAGLKAVAANYCVRHSGPDFLDGPHDD